MGGYVGGGAGPFLGGGTSVTGAGTAGMVMANVITFLASDPFKTIRDNAKRKTAQRIADSGGYNTLTAYQKSLINQPEIIISPGIPNSVIITGIVFVIGIILFLVLRTLRR